MRVAAVMLALAVCVPWIARGADARRDPPEPPARPAAGDEIPGRYIVRFRDTVDVDAYTRKIESKHRFRSQQRYRRALKGFAGELPRRVVDALRNDPNVISIEPDRVVTVDDETLPTGIDRIDAEPSKNPVAGTPPDVDVAIIDTGIDLAHPDLTVAGGFASHNDSLGMLQFCGITESYRDEFGHGTHVAGIVGALDNGDGVMGVTPGARLWSVRVLGRTGSGCLSDVIAGVDWVTANASTIEVANMSLGTTDSPQLCQAVAQSISAGVVYVAAAGNNNRDARSYSPANCPGVIAVSAIADYDGAPGGVASPTCEDRGPDDTLALFSNWGPAVDVAAPGVCIASTFMGGGTALMSGTSMASPIVTGAVVRMIAAQGRTQPSGDQQVMAALNSWGMLVAQGQPCAFAGRQSSVEPMIYLGQDCARGNVEVPGTTPPLPPGIPPQVTPLVLVPDGAVTDALPAPAAQFGELMARGDVDGDGQSDLAVADSTDRLSLIMSAPAPAAAAPVVVSSDAAPSALAIDDADGDGFGDLIVGRPSHGAGEIQVYFGPQLSRQISIVPAAGNDGDAFGSAVAAGDVDGDGATDLVTAAPGADDGAGALAVIYGPAFDTQTAIANTVPGSTLGAALAFGDADADGDREIISGSTSAGGGEILAFSSPLFEPSLLASSAATGFGGTIALADLNGDGDEELVAGTDDGVTVIDGSPAASSEQTIDIPGFEDVLATGDINGDGYGDILVGLPSSGPGGVVDVFMGPQLEYLYVYRPDDPEPGDRFGGAVVGESGRLWASASQRSVAGIEGAGSLFWHDVIDTDEDTMFDGIDNCDGIANADQHNTDAMARPAGPKLVRDVSVPNGDALGDACDPDDDNDGLPDSVESQFPMPGCFASAKTNPELMDSDGDHLSDGWECSAAVGTDPMNAFSHALGSGSADADADGVLDTVELRGYGTSAAATDSDGDGCPDMVEIGSVNGDMALNTTDLLFYARRLAWPISPFLPPDPAQDYLLDVNKDGSLNYGDLLTIRRWVFLAQPPACQR